MKGIELHLEVAEPVVLTRGAGRRNSSASFDHVPGSSLRGAIAARYVARHGVDDRFEQLFERGNRFLSALPADSEGNRGYPVPASRAVCKADRSHPAHDPNGLLRAADGAQRLISARQSPDSPEWPRNCVTCGAPMTSASGWIDRSGSPLNVRMVSSTRSAMENGVAKEGALFGNEAIGVGERLTAVLRGPEAEEIVERAELVDGSTLRVGRGRTTGGVLRIVWSRPEPAIDLDDLVSSWEGGLVLVLRSPAVLIDHLLRPTGVPRLALNGFALVHSWTSAMTLYGWNAGQGLPKAIDQAVAEGSTYTYELVDPDHWGETDPLQQLLDQGVGLRRAEGFGEVDVCPPSLTALP